MDGAKWRSPQTIRRHVRIGQFICERADVGRQRDALREAVKQWPTFKIHEPSEGHARLKLAGTHTARARKFIAISMMNKLTEAVVDTQSIWNVSDVAHSTVSPQMQPSPN